MSLRSKFVKPAAALAMLLGLTNGVPRYEMGDMGVYTSQADARTALQTRLSEALIDQVLEEQKGKVLQVMDTLPHDHPQQSALKASVRDLVAEQKKLNIGEDAEFRKQQAIIADKNFVPRLNRELATQRSDAGLTFDFDPADLTFEIAKTVVIDSKNICESAIQRPGLLGCWTASVEREALTDKNQRPGRGAAYGKFMDEFWRSMDSQLQASKPKMVADTLGMVEKAYLAASKKHEADVQKFGIGAHLNIFTSRKIDQGHDILLNAKELIQKSLIKRQEIEGMFNIDGVKNIDFGFEIAIKFRRTANPNDYVIETIGRALGRYLPLTMTSPATDLLGDVKRIRDMNAYPNHGNNYLVSVAAADAGWQLKPQPPKL